MQLLRKWLKPTLPKAFAVSALAVVYAWVDSTSTPEIPKVRKAAAPVAQVAQPAAPASDLFVDPVKPASPKPSIAKPAKKKIVRRKHKKIPRRAEAKVKPKRASQRKAPVLITKKRFVPAAALAELVENELLSDSALPSLAALNVTGPLDTILDEALDETPRTPLFHKDQMVASAEMDADFWLEDSIPTYRPVQLAVMSKLVGQNFEENKATLKAAKEEAAEIVSIEAPPFVEPTEPKLVKPAVVEVAKAPAPKNESKPAIVAKAKREPVPVAAPTHEAEEAKNEVPKAVVEAREAPPQPIENLTAVEAAIEPPPAALVESPTLVEAAEAEISDSEKNQLVAAAEPELDSQDVTTQAAPLPAPVLATPALPVPVPVASPRKELVPPAKAAPEERAVEAPTVAAPLAKLSRSVAPQKSEAATKSGKTGVIDGKLEGRFRVGPRLERWLREQGHAEILLHPTGSRDPQDNVHLGTIHAGENFQLARQDLVGEYRLHARFFSRKSSSLRADVAYPEPIAADNYKALIDFYVSDKEFMKARTRRKQSGSSASVITIPVFETAGGSEEDPLRGDFRTPRPIPKARVTVLGFEDWGVFESDANGNVRISNVPSRSELLIRSEADGFMPTMKLVNVADSGTHVPIYMLSQSKLPAIRYYTQTEQQKDKALVLGRSFDPASRTPLAGESLKLSFRKGDALYFSEYQSEDAAKLGIFNAWTAMFLGAIPDLALKATTDLGLFAFMNVSGSYRALLRPEKRALFTYLYPGHLNYFEFGRGGNGVLNGKLVDPFGGKIPEARIRIVGDKSYEVFTDANNRFRIEGLDYSGQITLEIEAPGYPTMWQDVAFNPADSEREFEFYILENDLVEETARRAKVKRQPSAGALVGGAETSFFRGGTGCVRVTLEDLNGNLVSAEQGPFPFGAEGQMKNEKLCLTQASPGFVYFNLPLGQYRQKFLAEDGSLLRTHVRNIGTKSVSISVN
ncbi:MAG: carboxypeptidase regulatory-like domain-containing protein [Bdellovibrionaceae bacterium]|nr:carboxypeptidase regulatory-like domain-containing protein [Bdellovibrionales bacterium]MCB9253417.1 carboxypeptidase regulatory-like domain-containing protein [Pseudobdellovibrionaceae bacterium]